ncbi:MAG: FecR domain-containing protein [Candidatus Babeliales bacterium]
MKNIEKHIVEKFFNNTCTSNQAKQVLDWFDTKEGKVYLEQKLDYDIDRMEDDRVNYMVQDLDSMKMKRIIQHRIKPGILGARKKCFYFEPYKLVAAVAVILLTTSLTWLYQINEIEKATVREIAKKTPTHHLTNEGQQKMITLRDGSKVRLNGDSELWVSGDFLENKREVRLTGEAYFEVEHDPDKPFIIQSDQGSIQVLGTSFNVKSLTSKENIQVAVVEGSVSLRSTTKGEENRSVVLNEGQFGYLDPYEISVEDYGVENYLIWMRGRLIFEDLKLSQVCTQLNRLYDVQCNFIDKSLKHLNLTANFSAESLEKVITVISLTLDLDYRKDKNKITWIKK